MSTKSKRKMTVGGLAITAAILIVMGLSLAKTAKAALPESSLILQEVAKACNVNETRKLMLFVSAAPMGQTVATKEQVELYIANPKHFAAAQQSSTCWTRDRWVRYVRAVNDEQRLAMAPK